MYKIGKGLEQTGSANFLGLIVFAIAVGKIAGSMGKEAEVFLKFITTFNAIVTKLIVLVMWYVCKDLSLKPRPKPIRNTLFVIRNSTLKASF